MSTKPETKAPASASASNTNLAQQPFSLEAAKAMGHLDCIVVGSGVGGLAGGGLARAHWQKSARRRASPHGRRRHARV